MSIQLSAASRNARLDALETAIGTTPILRIYSGTTPANCAAAVTGTVLAQMALPSDWLTAASAGAKSKSGTWADNSANATGTATHFRIYDSGDTTCHLQGSVSGVGGGGDLVLDTTSIGITETVTVVAFAITESNA